MGSHIIGGEPMGTYIVSGQLGFLLQYQVFCSNYIPPPPPPPPPWGNSEQWGKSLFFAAE